MDGEISEIIAAIYESAVDPERWQDTLVRLGDALGGAAFVMSAIGADERLNFIVTTRQDPQLARAIADRFVTAAANPLIAAVRQLPSGTQTRRSAIHPDAAYFRSALWNEVFRLQNLAHRAVACVLRSAECTVPLGVLRGTADDDFSDRQHGIIGAILPHLRRSMQIMLRIQALEHEVAVSSASLDRLPFGVILADASCRVLHCNRAAHEITEAGDGLRVRNGVLAAQRCSDTTALGDAVRRVVACRAHGGTTVLISRAEGRRAHIALVAPLGPETRVPFAPQQLCALILLNDPERPHPGLAGHLVGTFHLSAAEAELAVALLHGKRLEEFAEERGTSMNTVKAQMKSVFLKTDTSRQSELVRLLMHIPT